MQADGFATFMSYHQQQIPDLSPASIPANAYGNP
jgi:hypothetical protein